MASQTQLMTCSGCGRRAAVTLPAGSAREDWDAALSAQSWQAVVGEDGKLAFQCQGGVEHLGVVSDEAALYDLLKG